MRVGPSKAEVVMTKRDVSNRNRYSSREGDQRAFSKSGDHLKISLQDQASVFCLEAFGNTKVES